MTTSRPKACGWVLVFAVLGTTMTGCEKFKPAPPKPKPPERKPTSKPRTKPAATKPATAPATAPATKPVASPTPWKNIRKVTAEQSFKMFQRLNQARALRVPVLTEPPLVDGELDEVYKKATPVKFGFLDGREGLPAAATTLYLVSTRKEMFVFFNCESPDMSALRQTVEERDGNVWDDDCVELFLDPLNKRDLDYAQIGINPLGTIADVRSPRRKRDQRWKCKMVVRTVVGEKAWTVELSIPFSQLVDDDDFFNRVWAANFNRLAHLPEAREDTAWCPTGRGSSHVPARFGALWFEAGSIYVDYAHWTGPRQVYGPPPRSLFRGAYVSPEIMAKCTDLTPNPSKTYWFGKTMLPNNSEALIVLTDDRAIQITSLHGWKPIFARWINDKLLYVWRPINDEEGYYGVYDVERGKVVAEEMENNGMGLWDKILGKKRPKQELPRL